MTGNGNRTTYKNSEIGVGLLLFYPHYKRETVVLTPKIRGKFPDFFPPVTHFGNQESCSFDGAWDIHSLDTV